MNHRYEPPEQALDPFPLQAAGCSYLPTSAFSGVGIVRLSLLLHPYTDLQKASLTNKKSNKMDCRYCRDKIDEYVEGRLGKDDSIFFEQHLHTCAKCAELLHVQKLSDSIINDEKAVFPDFFLTARIMNRIENSGRETGSALTGILRPVMAMIAIAAAIFAGVLIGNISKTPEGVRAPVELALMNDAEIESVNVLTAE